MRLRNGEAVVSADGALCADTGEFTGRSPKDKFTVRDALTDKSMWWAGNKSITAEQFEALYQDFLKHAEGKTLFAQDLYGGADPSFRIKTRVFTEFAWHSLFIRKLLIRPEASRARELRAGTDHRRPAELPRRSQTSRRALGERHRHRFRPQDRPDRRLLLCRRDEEERVHHAELLSAREGRDADALLGQCRPRRRHRDLLRPVRHRQDHALGRSDAHADRRRRAWLGHGRHLQFRRRLLRQVHQAVAGGRARDLCGQQALRRGAGERRARRAHPRARFRRRLQDREHPLGLSARIHSQRLAHRPRAASEEHRHAGRRRLRRAAADRQADAGAGDVSLPVRLHRQGRRHRARPRHRAAAGILDLLRLAVPAARSLASTATCCAS